MRSRRRNALLALLWFTLPTADAAAAENVIVKGSDTLGSKMVPLLAEAFKSRMGDRGALVSFEIGAEGSATGVAAAMDGAADIGMSSRPLSKTELALAQARGVSLTAIPVARDGIAVVVNQASPLDALSLRQVEAIFTGEIRDWAGIAETPGPISAYTRNTSSGTYSAFRTLAMDGRDYGAETLKMASNEQIVAEVARNPLGVGYVGLAYINAPGIKVVEVDGFHPEEGADYPLARPLYFIIDRNEDLSPAANDFIGFTLSPEGQRIVRQVHFLAVY